MWQGCRGKSAGGKGVEARWSGKGGVAKVEWQEWGMDE